jgi:hypothetical protein
MRHPNAKLIAIAVPGTLAMAASPNSTRHYKPWAKLRVLVATATGSASGNNQQAFFFVGRRYIGTATWVPSASLAYVGQTSTRVRLEFGVFGPGSGDCCPTIDTYSAFIATRSTTPGGKEHRTAPTC